MSLANRVKTPPKSVGGLPCSLGAVIDTLKGAELTALKEMLGDRDNWGWTAQQVHDALTAEGHEVALRSINPHRGGTCRCAKK